MNSIDLRLSYEEKAHTWGFRNEVLNTLVADFLQGASIVAHKISPILPMLPGGIHISRQLREAFFEAGAEIAEAKENMTDENLKTTVADILERFAVSVREAIAENGFVASTGDCRGACKYNTGDRSEYRNYGW